MPISCDIVTHMKTTIEITDSLFKEAKDLARAEETTLRALVEEGLHEVIKRRRKRRRFKLRDASVGGKGLQPEYDGAGWDKLRRAAYEGRGG